MIKISNLVKKYDNITAVNGLNLSIDRGTSFGFLGPNGAGKTTTIMILLGIITPTSGEVEIAGQPVGGNSLQVNKIVGFVGDNQSFYDEMTAWEYLMFFGKLYEVEHAEERALDLLEKVDLINRKDSMIHGFSTGMRKKLGVVRSLLHSPQILILDEPVSGLDPYGILQVRELLLEEKKKGCTVVISSHILSEIENTVDKVGIIAQGKIIAEGSLEAIKNQGSQKTIIELEFDQYQNRAPVNFMELPFVKSVSTNLNTVSLEIARDSDYRPEIGKFIVMNQLIPIRMERKQASLEDTFITITEQSLPQLTKSILARSSKRMD
jgi:ABC-type multidrug transport system ATPase subunit